MGNEKSKLNKNLDSQTTQFNPNKLYVSSKEPENLKSISPSTSGQFDESDKMEEIKIRESLIIEPDLFVKQSNLNPLDTYTLIEKIGEGYYGEVWKVENKITGNICAMKKMIKKQKTSIEDEIGIMNEIEVMKKLDHPNIVKIFKFYITEEAFYLIMELCSVGELYYEIINCESFTEEKAAYIMYQILSVVFYCHSNNIIHRDLKPENILIEKKESNGFIRIKICDFGTAKMFEKGRIERKIVGSSYYIAPEVLSKNYDEKCDLWSCGVIMYILLSGRAPFEGNTDQEVMEKVRLGKYSLSVTPFDKISNEAKDLIQSLLKIDPLDRISADEALKHPWFITNNTRQKVNDILKDPYKEKIIEKFMSNLKAYRNINRLQQISVAYLVHNFPQMEEIENAYKVFNKFDVNGDGRVSREEFKGGLRSFTSLSQEQLEEESERIYKVIDTNYNGFIELEEFVRAAIDKSIFINNDILKFAFLFLDKNETGKITIEDLIEIFNQNNSNICNPVIEKQLRSIFEEVDLNKDGKISFEEFKIMMKQILDVNGDHNTSN